MPALDRKNLSTCTEQTKLLPLLIACTAPTLVMGGSKEVKGCDALEDYQSDSGRCQAMITTHSALAKSLRTHET
jgi:hypothetical protein